MKKCIEKSEGFEIVWMSVSRIEDTSSHGEGSNLPFANDHNNVIVFIDGSGWSRRKTNRVRVHILSPRGEEWGRQLVSSEEFLKDLRACVRIILKDLDGKLVMEVRHVPYAWAHA
jgi:hypothetical protein